MTSSDTYTKRLESHYAAALDMDDLKSQLVNCCRYKKRFQEQRARDSELAALSIFSPKHYGNASYKVEDYLMSMR